MTGRAVWSCTAPLTLLMVALLASTAAAGPPAPAPEEASVELAINTARVWLTTMEDLSTAVSDLAQAEGQPPAAINSTITRTHSMEPEGYMVAPSNGQVADIAASITGFTAEQLHKGYEEPLVQIPFGWSPSEVFYNLQQVEEPLKLDACAIAGILTESLTSWDDPALAALNPTAQLPAQPITLVYLNLSMPITERLTQYLEQGCPAWPYGVLDNLWEVVEGHSNLVPSTDVEFNWQAVNSTPGAVCIGASMPVGQYVAEYPAAMQFAKLQTAVGGAFVPPDGALNDTAVAELAALAPAVAGPDADWSFVNIRCPSVYPVCYWGLATLAADLTPQGDRGLYIRDTAGFLLTSAGQRIVSQSFELGVPEELLPAALAAWQSIKVAPADGLHTGIPVPEAGPAPTPAPAPAPSAAARAGARASASVVLLSAVAAGALLLA